MTTPLAAVSKIVLKPSEVSSFVKKWRAHGKKIVLTQGSFDLVHIGHARYCAKAKEYGDVLIVGVDSDAKVRQRKGDDRPVVPQDERLEMLTYLAAVDLVVLKELEAEKYSLIKAIQPDVLVATAETYTPEKVKKLEEFCGKVIVLDPMATTSTSAKIRRLQIGMVQKISDKLSTRLNNTIAEVLKELRGE